MPKARLRRHDRTAAVIVNNAMGTLQFQETKASSQDLWSSLGDVGDEVRNNASPDCVIMEKAWAIHVRSAYFGCRHWLPSPLDKHCPAFFPNNEITQSSTRRPFIVYSPCPLRLHPASSARYLAKPAGAAHATTEPTPTTPPSYPQASTCKPRPLQSQEDASQHLRCAERA